MTQHDVDLAVRRLNRRLDKIIACTSGMPNYEEVAKRVSLVRAAIRPYDPWVWKPSKKVGWEERVDEKSGRLETRRMPGMKIYEFWIRSSRGTDDSELRAFPESWGKETIEDELYEWSHKHACWDSIENFIRYGYNEEDKIGSRA